MKCGAGTQGARRNAGAAAGVLRSAYGTRKPGVAPRAHVQGGRARQDARSRVVNHSCSPNAGLRSNRILVALRNIGCGEEICYDYSTTMSEGRWTMQCRCGDLNCRSTVGDFHDLPTPRQQHYLQLGVVQSFIVEEFWLTLARNDHGKGDFAAYGRAKRSQRERSIAGVHVSRPALARSPPAAIHADPQLVRLEHTR